MNGRNYSLLEIIRDPGVWVYETHELLKDGHYYIYRYDAQEGVFYRATVPAGAAAVHYYPMKPTESVPLGGWTTVKRRSLRTFQPKVIAGGKSV